MLNKRHQTLQERTFWGLVHKLQAMPSEPVYSAFKEAQLTAFMASLVPGYNFEPEDYDDAIVKMCRLDNEFTDRDRDLLANLTRAASAAAASINLDDEDEHLVKGGYVDDLQSFYWMISHIVGSFLTEAAAHRDPDWDW